MMVLDSAGPVRSDRDLLGCRKPPVSLRRFVSETELMTAILQDHLPFAPWMQAASARMPGVQPIAMADW